MTNYCFVHPDDEPVPDKAAETSDVSLNMVVNGDKQTVELQSDTKAKRVSFT